MQSIIIIIIIDQHNFKKNKQFLSMSKPFFPTALVLAKKLFCPTTSKTRTHVHYTRHAEQSPGGEALLGVMDVKHEENIPSLQ